MVVTDVAVSENTLFFMSLVGSLFFPAYSFAIPCERGRGRGKKIG